MFLYLVGPSIAPNQYIWNLPLCLHLNISSLLLLSSRLGSLKLIILISFNTQVISAIETICHRIFSIFQFISEVVSPWSLRFQKYIDQAVWFLSCGLEKECLWLYSRCIQLPAETPMCYIVTYADSHLHTCTYICRIIHNDTTTRTQE